MPEVLAAPSSPGAMGDTGGLLAMSYDATGLSLVRVVAWPIIGWAFDEVTPINPVPIVIGNPLKPPPVTGAIISPAWAQAINEFAVYVPDTGNGGWRGTFPEFLTWLATNNGAARKISGDFTVPPLSNAWSIWARSNPYLLGP